MISVDQINDLQNPDNGWFHIEKTGDHPVCYDEERGDAILRIAPDNIRAMVDEFNARDFNAPGMLIDGDHLSHDSGKDTRALGWLKKLDICELNGTPELFGFIEWTPRGLEMLKCKEYCQSSTEYADMPFNNGVFKPVKLDGFALTNRPRIEGKRPLCNRETTFPKPEPGAGRQAPSNGENTKQQSSTMPEPNPAPAQTPEPNPAPAQTPEPNDELLTKVLCRLSLENADEAEIMNKLDRLVALDNAETEAINAEVDSAVEEYKNGLPEENTFTEEQETALKNSLRESPVALQAFKNALNRKPSANTAKPQTGIPKRESLNNRIVNTPGVNIAAKKPSPSEAFRNRVAELTKDGKMSRYDACRKATAEGLVIGSN